MEAVPERLDEIRARLDAATPAPWVARDGNGFPYVDSPANAVPATRADADLIAHAPDDLRWLIEALEIYKETLALSAKEHIEDVAALTDDEFWAHVYPSTECEYDPTAEPLDVSIAQDVCGDCGSVGACAWDAEGRPLIHATSDGRDDE